jgi:hypothetical protein
MSEMRTDQGRNPKQEFRINDERPNRTRTISIRSDFGIGSNFERAGFVKCAIPLRYEAWTNMAKNRPWTDAESRVWNRAIDQEGPDLREGDRALGALLLVNGYIQNGGVGHAFDLTPDELAEGIKGYEYFGSHEMAEVIKGRISPHCHGPVAEHSL